MSINYDDNHRQLYRLGGQRGLRYSRMVCFIIGVFSLLLLFLIERFIRSPNKRGGDRRYYYARTVSYVRCGVGVGWGYNTRTKRICLNRVPSSFPTQFYRGGQVAWNTALRMRHTPEETATTSYHTTATTVIIIDVTHRSPDRRAFSFSSFSHTRVRYSHP
jgi:hypothetical protein